MLCPLVFSRTNVAASLSDSPLQAMNGSNEYVAPFDGYIAAISIVSSEAVAAGSIEAYSVISGTDADDSVILEVSELRKIKYYRPSAITVEAGQYIGAEIDTSGSYAPTTADITFVVWYSPIRNDPPEQLWS